MAFGLLHKLKESLRGKPSLEMQQDVIRGLTTAKIYKLLQSVGMSKSELAGELKVSKAAISGLLSGNRNFTIDKLTEIAYVLDCTPKIDFIPLDEQHAARVVGVATAANTVQMNTTGQAVTATAGYTYKVASNGR